MNKHTTRESLEKSVDSKLKIRTFLDEVYKDLLLRNRRADLNMTQRL
jgi:hypothetical protein